MTKDRTPSIKLVKVDLLKFDLDNPRLFDGYTSLKTDADVFEALDETADLGELLQSIAANGYIDIEPLVANENTLIVYEGNRRLAAIRLLRYPELSAEVGITVPPMADSKREGLKEISVYFVPSRETARAFIGFKHINGPHRWDSYPKARFATNWYRKEKPEVTIRDIARKLGDRHDVVRRLVNGMLILDQAREENLFDIRDRAKGRIFYFSHLYTAITRPGFREYLGLPEEWREQEPQPEPVPPEKFDQLQRVLHWIYGSQEKSLDPQVTSQNPHVRQLDKILRAPQARQLLESCGNRVEALRMVRTPTVAFEQALVIANQKTEEALSKVRAYDGNETLFETARSLDENGRILLDMMRRRRKQPAGG